MHPSWNQLEIYYIKSNTAVSDVICAITKHKFDVRSPKQFTLFTKNILHCYVILLTVKSLQLIIENVSFEVVLS